MGTDTMDELQPEIRIVTSRHVSCVGQGGALGHPKVWYRIPDETGFVECGYCDRRFVLAGSEAEQALDSPDKDGD